MANIANPLPYLVKRELGTLPDLKTQYFTKRLDAAKNLYRRELVCHFGCVNAVEFSSDGEQLVSGGDDRRVMLWQFGQAVFDHGKPAAMKAVHQSNIFCLGISMDNQKIYSGGNDDIVIVHDSETKSPLEVLQHQRAVCSLSIDPFNSRVVSTAGNDGRLLLFDTRQSVHESLVISRSRKAFHGVMFHPQQVGMLVSANARDGVALWDLRTPKHPVQRYNGNNGTGQNSMSVRFNSTGTHILALRRRMSPVLYAVQSQDPVAEFCHQDYYNSCTMKSCCFAGEGDQYVLSGSDDFNLYMWKIPDVEADLGTSRTVCHIVEPPHIVLYGHRSIVNQVRYNSQYCLIASSGVEKIIKIWSALEYPQMRGTLLDEAQGSDNPREIYSHEDYVSLVHHSGQYITHNYAEQSTSEDPRMMAFFDSLVQRELECLAEETDSLDGSSSGPSVQGNDSDSSDSDQIIVDYLPLPPKRNTQNGARSQRCSNRLARLVASRYSKNLRSQKRGAVSVSRHRRDKQPRSAVSKSSKASSSSSVKGKRHGGAGRGRPGGGAARGRLPGGAARGRVAGGRRPSVRAPPPRTISNHSSERTDSDDANSSYTDTLRIFRPLRRHTNLSRACKRKTKNNSYRKAMNLRSNAAGGPDSSRNKYNNFSEMEDNPALPSTSTGYRGPSSSALFRIAEVDSDEDHDEQSAGSRAISPQRQQQQYQQYQQQQQLVSVVPTPVNGSQPPQPPPERRLRSLLRRFRRSRSESSSSPPSAAAHSRSVARLMNETNESEVESSCSTETSHWWAAARHQRHRRPRRNYRPHHDSDSN